MFDRTTVKPGYTIDSNGTFRFSEGQEDLLETVNKELAARRNNFYAQRMDQILERARTEAKEQEMVEAANALRNISRGRNKSGKKRTKRNKYKKHTKKHIKKHTKKHGKKRKFNKKNKSYKKN